MNKVILKGRVGKDPEVRRLESGVAVAKFSLATTESYKDKDGNKQENTEWHNITAWRGSAEFVEKYVKKGTEVLITGKISTQKYTDQAGVEKYATNIIMESFEFCGSKTESRPSNVDADGVISDEPTVGAPNEDDDLPF